MDTLDPCSVSESVRHSFDCFLPFLTCSYGGVFHFLDELDGWMVGVENRETKHRSAHRTERGNRIGILDLETDGVELLLLPFYTLGSKGGWPLVF